MCPQMSPALSSKLSAVATWQVPLPLPLPLPPPPGGEVGAEAFNAAASPIRVGSTGTIVSLMEREEGEIKERRKQGKIESRKSAAAISRLFHSPELELKTEAISVSCGLPLMTARGSGGRATKLKKTQRRHQLLQRDFRTCRVPRDGETPRFLASTRSRHRRNPSADSAAMLLDTSFEADRITQLKSDCRIGRRPSMPSRLVKSELSGSGKGMVTADSVREPCLTTRDPRSIGVDVRKTVSVRGSTRIALVPVAQTEGTMTVSGKSPEDEVNKTGAEYQVFHYNSPDILSEAGSSPSVGSSNPSSGRLSSASKPPVAESRHLQETQLVVEGRRSDATNSAHSSRREEVDVSRHSTSSDSSWLQEALMPSKESSPISIEELRKSLLADRASKRVQQKSLPNATGKESPVFKKDVLVLRIPAPEPFQGQLHRESSRLRELLRESPRLRELQMESPKLRELQKEAPRQRELNMGPQSLRERFSSSAKLAADPQQSSAPGHSPSANPMDKIHQQATQTTNTISPTRQHRRVIQKGLLLPTNTTLKPGSSSSRVLPFVKYDTDEETEVTHNAKVKGAEKRRNLEGATTPLRGSRQTRHSSHKAPVLVSLSCSRPSWRKSRDKSVST